MSAWAAALAVALELPGAAPSGRPAATPVSFAARAASADLRTLPLEEFRPIFNADRGRVRLLVLFSPT